MQSTRPFWLQEEISKKCKTSGIKVILLTKQCQNHIVYKPILLNATHVSSCCGPTALSQQPSNHKLSLIWLEVLVQHLWSASLPAMQQQLHHSGRRNGLADQMWVQYASQHFNTIHKPACHTPTMRLFTGTHISSQQLDLVRLFKHCSCFACCSTDVKPDKASQKGCRRAYCCC